MPLVLRCMSDTKAGAWQVADQAQGSLSDVQSFGGQPQQPEALDQRIYAVPLAVMELPETKRV